MGGEVEKTTLSLNRDSRAIKESHNGGIRRERNMEGSVGFLGLPVDEETTYIAIGLGEEVKKIKAMVHSDTNKGRISVPKEEMDGILTNIIRAEPGDTSLRDRAEICEIREVGGHVGCFCK
jgi:hypothetical protein